MVGFKTISSALIAASSFLTPALGQGAPGRTEYTDEATGITFGTWTVGTFTFGLTLPADALTTDATEYIGYIKCPGGYCGLSHFGAMTQSLLLIAWPTETEVLTSFQFATGYVVPTLYAGDATVTQISSTVAADGSFELIYRCQGCFSWDHQGAARGVSTTEGTLVLGRAQHAEAPTETCPNDVTYKQHTAFGQFGANLEGLATAQYETWAALATKTVTGSCAGAEEPAETTTPETPSGTDAAEIPDATASEPATTPEDPEDPVATDAPAPAPVPTGSCQPASETETYDYIVVGAGAAGIPMADRLSEAGHSVLLIEKGPPSSGRYDGTLKPEWLEGTNLTRFDVPGLCNQIWVDSDGVACTDTDQMAGCVLGGGTAVNAGLWWKPNPADWDDSWPEGWKSTDVAAATDRAFDRIPGTDNPSTDGVLYGAEGFDVLSAGLEKAGWTNVKPNEQPDAKNHTYGRTQYMFSGGERGGPMATYLVSSLDRENFKLWVNTGVKRVVRSGAAISGVELECAGEGGYTGTVNVTPGTGRVILAAGTFGSAKMLLRSGIGPADQLELVAKSASDGATMIAQEEWINLPVGYNLQDHTNTDIYVTHPDVVFYDFYGAWTDPIAADKDAYLNGRTGILTQSAPNIGPMFWDEILGADGVTRSLQWTSRVEGEDKTGTDKTMIMSQYLGRGQTSRGRMGLTSGLTSTVLQHPFLRTPEDKAAVIEGINHAREVFAAVEGLTIAIPASNQTTEDYVDSLVVSSTSRRSNHWMGSAKLGLDDGRENNGTAVVDLDTKVYGTDNLFVVDASIFPGMSTGNPSAMIISASEYAAERILALTPGSNGGVITPTPGNNGTVPVIPVPTPGNGTTTPVTPPSEGEAEEPPKCHRRRARRGTARLARRYSH